PAPPTARPPARAAARVRVAPARPPAATAAIRRPRARSRRRRGTAAPSRSRARVGTARRDVADQQHEPGEDEREHGDLDDSKVPPVRVRDGMRLSTDPEQGGRADPCDEGLILILIRRGGRHAAILLRMRLRTRQRPAGFFTSCSGAREAAPRERRARYFVWVGCAVCTSSRYTVFVFSSTKNQTRPEPP